MLIKVFGPGCAKCEETKTLVEKFVQENNIAATVEKVTDLQQMMSMGIMSTPAVVIDGVIKCTGHVPSATELHSWISTPDATPASADVTSATSATAATAGVCSCGGKC